MSFSVDVLAGIAIELQRGVGHQDRFPDFLLFFRTEFHWIPIQLPDVGIFQRGFSRDDRERR